MTDLIFSFDTEDYINYDVADDIIKVAQLLRKNGIKGCYQTVGMMAEALREWGRQDVIDEISKYHEIGLHSHRHTMHPTIDEYTDISDFDMASELLLEDESIGLEKLKSVFGIEGQLPSACPPGDSTSYVAHYTYAKMGFPIYAGDHLYDARHSRPIFACNIAALQYNYSLEKLLFTATEDSLKKFIDQEIATRDVFVLYNHPQRVTCVTYCDLENFFRQNTPKNEWKRTAHHTDEEVATFYRNLEILIGLLKNDPRINITTYTDLAEKLASKRVITREILPDLKKQLDEYFFPVTTPDSYCIADVFHACADLLLGKDSHECGEVYGFLDTPYTADKPVTLSADEVKYIAARIKKDRFLPEFYLVDDKKVGPADWLRAALAVLVDGAESYTVMPSGQWQIDLDQFPALRDLCYKGSWCHCDSLEDRYLSKRFRLQSWTFRLPKGTERKIFY